MKAAPMTQKPSFPLMKQGDIQNIHHLQMPRWLFVDPRYMELALETKEYEQGLFGEGTDPASYVQAEYYRLVSESAAQRFFGSVKAAFEAQKGNVSGSTSVELGNYAIYSLTTNGSYYYIARVDQTVVIFVADESCKDQVKAMCKAMGY